MAVFSLNQEQAPPTPIFSFSADLPKVKPSANTIAREKALFPHLTNLPKEEIDPQIDSGLKTEVVQAAEAASKQAEITRIDDTVTRAAEEGKDINTTLDELESFMKDDPLMGVVISPATIHALRQSKNPLVVKAAQRKLANTAIALELIQAKREEASEEGFLTNFDFVDAFVSDLPLLSFSNFNNRKEWADQFSTLMESSDDPSYVKEEMSRLLDAAADQGLFTQSNRFYLGDFLDILSEGRYGTAALLQGTFATLDTAFAISSLADAAKLLAATGKGKKAVKETLADAVRADDPIAGHTVPSNFEEGMVTPAGARPSGRLPDEATAALELNIELRVSDELVKVRKAAGASFDSDAWEAFKAEKITEAVDNAEKAGLKRFIDADVTIDDWDNPYLVETFGTTKGLAFKDRRVAQKEAEAVLGEVVQLGPKEFVVRKRTNLPTGEYFSGTKIMDIASDLRLFPAAEPKEMGFGVMAKYFYSPLSQTSATSNALLKQGESARAFAQERLDKMYQPFLKAAGKEGIMSVGRVFQDLRDGTRAHLRKDLSMPEFRGAFNELNKRMPTQAEEDLYSMTLQRNIDAWFVKADSELKTFVNKGIQMFKVGDLEMTGVKASRGSIDPERLVWDVDQNKYIKVSDLSDTKQVIRLTEPQEFDFKLHDIIATNNVRTRELKHTDVLGYNPGGSRLYAPNQSNFILKQDRELKMADGTQRPVAPVAMLAAKTEKEAAKALAEINTLIKEIHSVISPSGVRLTGDFGKGTKVTTTSAKTGEAFTKDEYLRAVAGKANDKKLIDAISRASGWHRKIDSVESLVDYFAKSGLDLRKTIDMVEDGKAIIKGDDVVGDFSFREALTSPGVLRRGNVRKDNVLMGYGGKELDTVVPMEAIQRSYMSSVARMTDVAYEASAANGLIRRLAMSNLVAAKDFEAIRWLPLRQKLKALDGKILTGTKQGKRLELERQKILWRLEKRNFLDSFIQAKRDELGQWLYDKDWKGLSKFVDARSAEPVAAIRGVTFDVMLGLFSWEQFYVQASHIVNILGTADKGAGLQAVAVLPVVRGLLRNGHAHVTEAMSYRMAKVLNIEPKQFEDMVRVFQESGRNSIATSMADLGEDSSGKFLLKNIREKGRVFYNEGERLARITSHVTASLEYIKKNGAAADLRSVKAKQWVTNREDTLTFAMTSQSRAPIEQFPMTQFLSYTMRMFEFLASGLVADFKNLKAGGSWTKEIGPLSLKHKVKLFTTQAAFYGVSGIPGINFVLDKMDSETGVVSNSEWLDFLRKGVIDGLIGYITGVETELGRRLSWGEGLWQTMQKVGEEGVLELAAGPSYSVGKDILTSTGRLARNVANGQTDLAFDDLGTVARTIKSINTSYNAYLAFKYGEYWTKTHQKVTGGIDPYEAAAIAFGIPIEEVNNVWRTRKIMSDRSKDFRELAKIPSEIHRLLAFEYSNNGFNTEKADSLRKSLEFFYADLTPYEAKEIDRFVDSKAISLHEKTIIDTLRTPYFYEAN